MELYISNIKNILGKIQNGEDIPYGEFLNFHHKNCAIIKSYLKTIKRSLINIITKLDYSFDDIVKICSERLYIRNNKHQFVILFDFIDKYKQKFEEISDNEFFLIYKGFLVQIADQELARQYALADPIGAKIHRNIVESIKKSKNLKLIRDFKGYTVTINDCKPNNCLKLFPIDLLENEIYSRIDHRSLTTPYLLDVLHSVFKENESYEPSVLLIELVQIFKRIQSYEIVNMEEDQIINCEDITNYDIQQVRSEVELKLKQQLIFTYYYSGKMNLKEVEAFLNAFNDMFDDWCENYDNSASLYEYLNRYLPVCRKEFEDKYRSKIEYLLKIVREEFKNRLIKDL